MKQKTDMTKEQQEARKALKKLEKAIEIYIEYQKGSAAESAAWLVVWSARSAESAAYEKYAEKLMTLLSGEKYE